jgi:hypothetical protein
MPEGNGIESMRKRNANGGVTVQAIAGNHAVFLGLDLDATVRAGCLGFAIHRTDHDENEQYWLAGFKTFEPIVPIPDPDTIYSTRDHPLQTFYWGDYTRSRVIGSPTASFLATGRRRISSTRQAYPPSTAGHPGPDEEARASDHLSRRQLQHSRRQRRSRDEGHERSDHSAETGIGRPVLDRKRRQSRNAAATTGIRI